MHKSAISMRAFTKGRAAFDSDEEYRLALRGELDVREDFGYEAGKDPDDGEYDADDAVKAELHRYEEALGAKFIEVMERFMRDASGKREPGYLPFPPVRGREILAVFNDGSESLRLRYGAYGLAADRLEGLEVVNTWKNLDGYILYEWDEMFAEDAVQAEDAAKADFFDDLPGILGDGRRGAEFLDFVAKGDDATIELSREKRLCLVRDRAESEFRLTRIGEARALAAWDEDEFLERLREVAWDDLACRDCILGGGDIEDAWEHLDDAWYDEDEDGLVADSIGGFLAGVEDAKKAPSVGYVTRDVEVCGEKAVVTGRLEMKMVWGRGCPDMAQLTFSYDDGEETTFDVPLAFMRWWRFCRNLGW